MTDEVKEEPVQDFSFIVPECCREGWDTCKHVIRKEKPKKVNVGL